MTLTAIIKDTWYTQMTGDKSPFSRTVQIELTPQQEQVLALRKVGTNKGNDVFETIVDIFIEKQSDKAES